MFARTAADHQVSRRLRLKNALFKLAPLITGAAWVWVIMMSLEVVPITSASRATTLLLMAGAVLFNISTLLKKSSAAWALALFGLTVFLHHYLNTPLAPSLGAMSFATVIMLLLGIGILRRYLESQNIQHVIENMLGQPWLRKSPYPLFLVYGALTFLLSLAVVPLVGALTRHTKLDHIDHVRVAMRSVGSTMFLAPTTVGAAAVALMFPNIEWGQALLIGIPLAGGMMVLTCLSKPAEIREEDGVSADGVSNLQWLYQLVGLFALIFTASKALFGLGTVTAVALTVSMAGAISVVHSQGWKSLAQSVHSSFRTSSAEILMFIACGTLLVALQSPEASSSLQQMADNLASHLNSPSLQALVIVGGLPLLTICGIHPMVLFSAFFPIVHALSNVGMEVEYHWWIAMFVISQLISPVSISAVAAASATGLSSWNVSFRLHAIFAVLLAGYCIVYLWLVAALR